MSRLCDRRFLSLTSLIPHHSLRDTVLSLLPFKTQRNCHMPQVTLLDNRAGGLMPQSFRSSLHLDMERGLEKGREMRQEAERGELATQSESTT